MVEILKRDHSEQVRNPEAHAAHPEGVTEPTELQTAPGKVASTEAGSGSVQGSETAQASLETPAVHAAGDNGATAGTEVAPGALEREAIKKGVGTVDDLLKERPSSADEMLRAVLDMVEHPEHDK